MMWGYFDLAHLTLDTDGRQMLLGLLLTGAGMAFVFTAMSAAVMRTIPPPLLAAATGLYTLSRRIGGNIGYAFVANQIVHRTSFHRARLVDHLTPYDVWTPQLLDGLTGRLASSGVPPGVAEDSALRLLAGAGRRQAMMLAYNDVFWMMGMCFVLCLPLLFLLGRRHPRPAPAPGKPTVLPATAPPMASAVVGEVEEGVT